MGTSNTSRVVRLGSITIPISEVDKVILLRGHLSGVSGVVGEMAGLMLASGDDAGAVYQVPVGKKLVIVENPSSIAVNGEIGYGDTALPYNTPTAAAPTNEVNLPLVATQLSRATDVITSGHINEFGGGTVPIVIPASKYPFMKALNTSSSAQAGMFRCLLLDE